jgi:hypothetical protein
MRAVAADLKRRYGDLAEIVICVGETAEPSPHVLDPPVRALSVQTPLPANGAALSVRHPSRTRQKPTTAERGTLMTDADDHAIQTRLALDCPKLFGEIQARLLEIRDSLSEYKMDAGRLRTSAEELGAVVQRIEWLADLSTSPPLNAHRNSPRW